MNTAWPSPPRLAVLGAVRVRTGDGTIVEPAGRLSRALLIGLARAPAAGSTAALSEGALVDEVWGDAAPAGAHQALQTLVSRTRANLPPGLIVRRAQGYALALEQPDIDLGRARILASDAHALARAGDHAEALETLAAALALWVGEPGADAGEAPAAADLARHAETLREELLTARAGLLRSTGEPHAAAAILEQLVAMHPLDEQRVSGLMSAWDAAGRRTDALALFASTRARLRDELGVSPGSVLVAANAAILMSVPDTDDGAEVAPTPWRHLPAAPNELIGRSADVEAITALLRRSRVVTILGTGGLGKTRLALEVARRTSTPRVAFVELAGVRAADDVPLALASALGVRDVSSTRRLPESRPDERTRILSALRERETLLVMDNCEHLIAAASAWVADLLAEVDGLTVLTTTRTPLEIAGEQVYPLEPLASASESDATAPAVELFIERARSARPSAALSPDVVVRLCERLDGLPLAIELAAARVRSLSVEQIEERLEHRFALLTSGNRAAPDRHRTLRAVVEWSWDLLETDARNAFGLLAVFPDGFTADAAQHVLGGDADVLALLDALVTQSLVTARDTADGLVRYRMLETIREFGLDELRRAGRFDEAIGSVVAWADDSARALLNRWSGPDQPEVIRRARADQENLLFALRAAIVCTDPAAATGIFALIACVLSVTDAHADVAVFTPQVTAVTVDWDPDDQHASAAMIGMLVAAVTAGFTDAPRVALRARARLARWLRAGVVLPPAIEATVRAVTSVRQPSDFPKLLAGLAKADDPATALVGTLMTGQMAENGGDTDLARTAYLAAWELATRRGDVWAAAMCAGSLATLDVQAGRADEAMRWVDSASEGMVLLGIGTAYSDWNRALVLIALERLTEARATLERLRDAPEARNNEAEFLGIAHLGLAELARLDGDIQLAGTEYQAARTAIAQDVGYPNPWRLIILAWGTIAASTDGILPAAEIAVDSRVLRQLILELGTTRSGLIDLPVLGAAVLAIAAAEASVDAADQQGVAELVALAERIGARGDLPAMRIDAYIGRLTARGWDLATARSTAALLTRDEAAARAIEMIARPPLLD